MSHEPGSATDLAPASATSVSAFVAPRAVAELVNRRLTLLTQLGRIESQRKTLSDTPDLPSNATAELSRQERELRRIPDGQIATAALAKLQQRLADLDPNAEVDEPPVEIEAAAAVTDSNLEFDDDEVQDLPDDRLDDEIAEDDPPAAPESDNQYLSEYELELEDDDVEDDVPIAVESPVEQSSVSAAPIADPIYLEALELGCRQANIFIQRDALTDAILAEAARCLADEPLAQLLEANGCDAQTLFGWAAYATALQGLQSGTAKRLATINGQLASDQGRKPVRSSPTSQMTLVDEARLLGDLQTAISRELSAIEPIMVVDFWRVYEEAAVLLVNGRIEPDQQTPLRAMLRYGMIGAAPWLLSPASSAQMLDDCRTPLSQWEQTLASTHVLYADEYIDMAAKGHITPSIDQDLELNAKGSDRWKADRMWRKVVYSKTAVTVLTQIKDDLQARLDAIARANKKIETLIAALNPQAKGSRSKRSKRQEKLQANKVEAARFQRGVELIEQKHLADQNTGASDAQQKLGSLNTPLTPELFARRESIGIRQVCKLCAKLKEPFLPFVIRDNYKPQSAAVNDRQTVLTELAQIEKCDPRIFKSILVQHKKEANRIYSRFSPYCVLVPTQGIMGISWNPRSGTEVGRLVLPLLSTRPGALRRMLYEVMADFRYDTSKDEAGVDLLTSDTLVAAYATVRWDYRKRSKEVREKATIYNDETDRKNWRRHYDLYMSSALDGGKKLFFKCPEVYEVVCKYMGLPAGVDKLE